MAKDLLKKTKINRRNTKAALTRAGKSLRHVIGSQRPREEVRETLLKLQNAFETLIVQHEEFAKLIEDDEEFEAQETWLEESQEFFMNLETDTKLYLYSTEELQGNVPVNSKKTLSSDTENFKKSDTRSKLRVESNNMSDTVVDNVIKETKTLDINTSIDIVREIVRALVKC